MDDVTDRLPTCAFRAVLVDLLHDFPRRGDAAPGDSLSNRLESLEHEARQHEAPSETIAAIRGVQIMLRLAELPPLPPLGKDGAITTRPPAGQPKPR